MITKYIISALSAALLAMGGYVWYVDSKLNRQSAEMERLENALGNCSARLKNIREDAKDDATVDDPSVFPVPDDWMFPGGTDTGGD